MPASHRRRITVLRLTLATALPLISGCTRGFHHPELPAALGVPPVWQQPVVVASAEESQEPNRDLEARRQHAEILDNLRRGELEADAGRWDQAAQFYERVLRDDPRHAVAHHRLAIANDQVGNLASAERHYLAALEIRPSDPELLNDLGYSFLLQRRYQESEQILRKVLVAEPGHDLAMNNLGLLYASIGDVERGIAVLRVTHSDAEARAKLTGLMRGLDQLHDADTLAPPPPTPSESFDVRTVSIDEHLLRQSELRQSEQTAPPPQQRQATARTAARLLGLIDPSTSAVRSDVVRRQLGEQSPQPYRRGQARSPYAGAGSDAVSVVTANAEIATLARDDIDAQELPLWTPPRALSDVDASVSPNDQLPIINAYDRGGAGLQQTAADVAAFPAGRQRQPYERSHANYQARHLPPPIFAETSRPARNGDFANTDRDESHLVGHSRAAHTGSAYAGSSDSASLNQGMPHDDRATQW